MHAAVLNYLTLCLYLHRAPSSMGVELKRGLWGPFTANSERVLLDSYGCLLDGR